MLQVDGAACGQLGEPDVQYEPLVAVVVANAEIALASRLQRDQVAVDVIERDLNGDSSRRRIST